MLTDIVKNSGISCSNVPGLTASLYPNITGNEAGVVTVLDSVTIPAGAFGLDGEFMEFNYFGTFSGDAATEVLLYFGTDALFDSGVIDPANETFCLSGTMMRLASNKQLCTSSLVTTSLQVNKVTSTTVTFGAAKVIEFKATGTGANDVILSGATRKFFFQNR